MIIFFNYLLTTRPHLNCYLSPQTECGDTAAVALLLTTKVNRDSERKVRTNVFLIFYLDIIIYLFNYLLTQRPCHGSYLSPQTEYEDAMAVAPLLTTIRNWDSERTVRKKYFPFFSLIFFL
jgi:hypothetical protein